MVHVPSTAILLAVTLCSVLPSGSAAQDPPRRAETFSTIAWPAWEAPEAPSFEPVRSASPPTAALIPVTFLGAFAGSYVGQRIGIYGVGAGLPGLVVGYGAASVFGSAALATAFTGRSDPATFKRAAMGALGGLVFGGIGALVAAEMEYDYDGWMVGFALGQATLTTLAVHGG